MPTFRGFQAPGRFEADIRDLEVVQGEVPADLDGAYYRVGPDPQFPPLLGNDIFLNGDGLVSMFRFEDGRVDFKCRWVRTPKFLVEREAGRALFGAYRNPFTDDRSVRGLSRGTANTNLLWHAGRMLALKEDSHPVEIDPLTLETTGPWDYDGALTSATATAHPKVDADTGTLVFFGYAAKGETTPDIAYYEADVDGTIIFERWLTAPYGSMVHDFAVTENHVMFPVVPLVSDLKRLKDGLPHFAWDPSKPVYRRGPADGDNGSMLRAFVEVDRATMGPERLAARLPAYERLHRYVPAVPRRRPTLQEPAAEEWRRRYQLSPRILFVLDGTGPAGVENQISALRAGAGLLSRFPHDIPVLLAPLADLLQHPPSAPV